MYGDCPNFRGQHDAPPEKELHRRENRTVPLTRALQTGDVPVLLGYNTNGLAHHELFDAIDLLAEIGYRSVAITIDHGALTPGDRRTPGQLRRLRRLLARRGMGSVIETATGSCSIRAET